MRILAFACYALGVCAAATLLDACSKAGASNATRDATASIAPISSAAPTAMPTWPGYVAIDYGKPGQPSLTLPDASRVHWALSKVKACQRPLVRYAFPGGGGPVVLFFAIPPNSGAHVFGEGDAYYVPTQDSVIPMPGDTEDYGLIQKEGIRWDIDRQPCAPAGASLFTVSAGDTSPGQIRVAVHPSATIYNVAVACMRLIRKPPQNVDESAAAISLRKLPAIEAEESVEPKVEGGDSYLKPLWSCLVLDTATGQVSTLESYQEQHRGAPAGGTYLVIVAYSQRGGTEEYAPIELTWAGSYNGIDSWLSRIPSDAVRECCERALFSFLHGYIEHNLR